MPIAKYTKTKKPAQNASNQKGYTESSGSAAAKRNCRAVGGTWKNGKCVGGVL